MDRILKHITSYFFFLFFFAGTLSAQLDSPIVLGISSGFGDAEIEVYVTAIEFSDVLGMQFGLEFDTDKLEFLRAEEALTDDFNFGGINVVGNQILFVNVYDSFIPLSVSAGSQLFKLVFRSLQEGVTEIKGSDLLIQFEGVKPGPTATDLIIQSGLVATHGLGIVGNIYYDADENCMFDNESGVSEWPIEITDGTNSWFRFTNTNGDFSAALPFGSYTVKMLDSPFPNWETCTDEFTFAIDEDSEPEAINNGVILTAECPALEIDMSVNRLRRCFSNNRYFIDYVNRGLPAQGVTIAFETDEFISIEDTSEPIASTNNNVYTFDIGDLGVNESGRIIITFSVDCDNTVLGQTLCSKATILPKISCVDFAWDGPQLSLTGDCIDDKASFIVTNEGTENMSVAIGYNIVEDDLIMPKYLGDLILDVGANEVIEIPTEGKTIRFEIPQIDGHPFAGTLNAFVEACGADQNGEFSLGFANMFSNANPDPQVVVVCEEIIGSWDPNDKAAAPVGYRDEQYLKANTAINYKIRFQNTGTDTAFNIVIRDTLSEHLDVSSLNVGPSSHRYEYLITDNRELVFYFNNIQLPDSTTNEVESHGHLTFTIGQQPDLKDGTLLKNKAGIYFDFNEPIITNEVFHTIGEEFVDIALSSNNVLDREKAGTKISPNPFRESTNFTFNNEEHQEAKLEIIDINGKKLLEQQSNKDHFEIRADYLNGGIFFYKLSLSDVLIDSGKLIVN